MKSGKATVVGNGDERRKRAGSVGYQRLLLGSGRG